MHLFYTFENSLRFVAYVVCISATLAHISWSVQNYFLLFLCLQFNKQIKVLTSKKCSYRGGGGGLRMIFSPTNSFKLRMVF